MSDKLDVAKDITGFVLEQCVEGANKANDNASPAEIAHAVISMLLINLAGYQEEDSVLVMCRKLADGWKAHIHYDYLSSDHDHFKEDFAWNVAENPDKP